VKKVSDIVAEIAAASREQSSGIEQVNRAVMQMDELTQQNAALVEEATAASQAMAEQVRGLNQMLDRYRVNDMIETARNYAAPAAAAVPARGQTAARAERRGSHRPWADRPKSSAGAADLAAARKVSRGNGTLSAVNGPAAPATALGAQGAETKSSDSEWREF
jgi:hypothetical protein